MDNRMTVNQQPSDAILFRTPFATGIISKVINLFIKKQGYDTKASIHEVTVSHSNLDGKIRVHMDLYIDCTEKDIHKIMEGL